MLGQWVTQAACPALHAVNRYWIPAEDLDEFNRHIVGTIEVVAKYR